MSVQETNLTAIADAIRLKEGSTDSITASSFAERIAAIQTGAPLPSWGISTLSSSGFWVGTAYGDGKFVIVRSQSTEAAYSTDGINWETIKLPVKVSAYKIDYCGGKFLITDGYSSSNTMLYSLDGINWGTITLPISGSWRGFAYGNGKFVAVSGTESSNAIYSVDGITWSHATLPTGVTWLENVAYGNGVFVAIAKNPIYSTDGVHWNNSTSLASISGLGSWKFVMYGNGKFVAHKTRSNTAVYSMDGINWTSIELPFSDEWGSSIYMGGKFLIPARDKGYVLYSTDGINWSQSILPITKDCYTCGYGDGKIILTTTKNNLFYIQDTYAALP